MSLSLPSLHTGPPHDRSFRSHQALLAIWNPHQHHRGCCPARSCTFLRSRSPNTTLCPSLVKTRLQGEDRNVFNKSFLLVFSHTTPPPLYQYHVKHFTLSFNQLKFWTIADLVPFFTNPMSSPVPDPACHYLCSKALQHIQQNEQKSIRSHHQRAT